MIRHPSNTNLSLHYENTYQGFPVQIEKGPFISEYLNRLYQAVGRALTQYPRVFAFRFDLRLPTEIQLPDFVCTNQVIERFMESFKAKIAHNRNQARQLNKYAHDSKVRYVWAREQGQHVQSP